MQIKFNKMVKPVAPQMDELKTADAVKPAVQTPPSMTPPVQTSPFAEKEIKEAVTETEQTVEAAAPAEEIQEEAVQPVPERPAVPYTAPVMTMAERPAPIGMGIEESLKKCLGQTIRVYMSDHEYVSGRLEMVENGWIKLSNARSAGSEYYSDEDIINTSNLVRVRYSKVIDKSAYVDFMNSMTK